MENDHPRSSAVSACSRNTVRAGLPPVSRWRDPENSLSSTYSTSMHFPGDPGEKSPVVLRVSVNTQMHAPGPPHVRRLRNVARTPSCTLRVYPASVGATRGDLISAVFTPFHGHKHKNARRERDSRCTSAPSSRTGTVAISGAHRHSPVPSRPCLPSSCCSKQPAASAWFRAVGEARNDRPAAVGARSDDNHLAVDRRGCVENRASQSDAASPHHADFAGEPGDVAGAPEAMRYRFPLQQARYVPCTACTDVLQTRVRVPRGTTTSVAWDSSPTATLRHARYVPPRSGRADALVRARERSPPGAVLGWACGTSILGAACPQLRTSRCCPELRSTPCTLSRPLCILFPRAPLLRPSAAEEPLSALDSLQPLGTRARVHPTRDSKPADAAPGIGVPQMVWCKCL
ncbi:hypothetical protein BC628DRAFT_1123108 [Trametes gibbosa]|nr:hypothetical protein BC628DRAFT_1123108 [Trametes gibbosa]